MNGLNIQTEDFLKLPYKQQMRVLYENTEELKRMIGNYSNHVKVLKWMVSGSYALISITFLTLMRHVT